MHDFGNVAILPDRRSFLGAGAGLISLGGLAVLTGGCAGEQPGNAMPEHASDEPPALPVLDGTRPLPRGFGQHLRASQLSRHFAPAFSQLGGELNFEAATELVFTGLPEAARNPRTALVPLGGGNPERPFAWLYTSNQAGREYGAILEVLPAGRLRFFVDPSLANGFELIYGADNRLLGIQLFGTMSRRLRAIFECIVRYVGGNPAMVATCISLCMAGGIMSPACLLCIGASAAVALICWWGTP